MACLGPDGTAKPERTSIKFKRMEPFMEERSEGDRFGFKLMGYKHKSEFYVENDTEMDGWLDVLNPLVVLVEIQEDFNIFEKLGEGAYSSVFRG